MDKLTFGVEDDLIGVDGELSTLADCDLVPLLISSLYLCLSPLSKSALWDFNNKTCSTNCA